MSNFSFSFCSSLADLEPRTLGLIWRAKIYEVSQAAQGRKGRWYLEPCALYTLNNNSKFLSWLHVWSTTALFWTTKDTRRSFARQYATERPDARAIPVWKHFVQNAFACFVYRGSERPLERWGVPVTGYTYLSLIRVGSALVLFNLIPTMHFLYFLRKLFIWSMSTIMPSSRNYSFSEPIDKFSGWFP